MLNKNGFNKKNNNNSNEALTWLIFIISPIISFLIAIVNFKKRNLRKFIVLFGGVYGLSFVPLPMSDATRYKLAYDSYSNYSFISYLDDILNIYSIESLFPDVYIYTIFYVGNIFSNNSQFFFLIVGVVYFYWFVKLIGTIFDLSPNIRKYAYVVFFLSLTFMLPVSSGINGVRWPLAFVVFMYGSINLILQNKIKFLLISSLSLFIHFSFFPVVIILIMFYYLPFFKKTNLLFYFALFAFLLDTALNNLLIDNIQFFGDLSERKLSDYTGEGYLTKRNEQIKNWNFYVSFLRFGVYYFSCIALLIMWFNQKKMNKNSVSNRLFNFAILFTSISFLSSTTLDISINRYIWISTFLTFVYLIYIATLNNNSKTIKILAYVFLPIVFFRTLFILKTDFETFGIEVFSNMFLFF